MDKRIVLRFRPPDLIRENLQPRKQACSMEHSVLLHTRTEHSDLYRRFCLWGCMIRRSTIFVPPPKGDPFVLCSVAAVLFGWGGGRQMYSVCRTPPQTTGIQTTALGVDASGEISQLEVLEPNL